jgi:homoserine kinase
MPVDPPTAVAVRVPATSANLGPGFDALGLALGLYDTVEVSRPPAGGPLPGPLIEITGEGAGQLPTSETHLALRAFREACDRLDFPAPRVRLRATNAIPQSRGLGSSAATICVGVLAAFALSGTDDPDRGLALQIAADVEGHPDNVAACLFGGATIAWRDDDATVRSVRVEPAEQVRPVAFIPAVRTSTHESRGALPREISHTAAAATAGRAALLIAALTTRPDLLLAATEDWLHQPYRLPRLPAQAALVETLRGAGIPAVLSGSGPTVLALARSESEVAMALDLGANGAHETAEGAALTGRRLPVDRDGALVTVLR